MRFQVLGPLEIYADNGELIHIGGINPQRLMAALLLAAGDVVPLERLVDIVWEDRPPRSARRNIQTYVWSLRRALGRVEEAPRLHTHGAGYLLTVHPGELDAQRCTELTARGQTLRDSDPARAAESFRAAIGLWQGTALSELISNGSPLLAHTTRLEESRLETWERYFDAELAAGRHAAVVAELGEIAAQHPWRERLTGLRMIAMYRCGRQAEALAAYTGERTELIDGIGVEPGPELAGLHQRVLAADPLLLWPGPPAGPASPEPLDVVPHELPPSVRAFTGRARELSVLEEMARPADLGTPALVIISGMGGIGKTSLAVRWAHLARDRFRDGELYVDLRGHHPDRRPVAAADVLARFLSSLGVSAEAIPPQAEERIQLYRTLVSRRQLLIVLDNAATAAQVRALLPASATCTVLVTARSRLSGLVAREGARRVNLDVLTADDACTLLCRALGADRIASEPAAAAALAERCGYLPLALRIVAERVSSEPGTTIAQAVHDLDDRRTRLNQLAADGDPASIVRDVLDWSYERLGATAQTMFRLLGAADSAEISSNAATALAGTADAAAAAELDTLVGAHLLERIAPERFRMHDLLRLLAAQHGSGTQRDEARTAALSRMLGWYLSTALAARAALDPHLPPMPPVPGHPLPPPRQFHHRAEALAWCELEQANLVVAVGRAFDLGLYEIAWRLPTALYGFFDLRKRYSDWIATHRIAAAAARQLGNRDAEGLILCNLGNAFRSLSRLAEASRCYREALTLFRAAGYRPGEAKALANLASTYHALGQLDAAIDTAGQAVQAFRELDDA